MPRATSVRVLDNEDDQEWGGGDLFVSGCLGCSNGEGQVGLYLALEGSVRTHGASTHALSFLLQSAFFPTQAGIERGPGNKLHKLVFGKLPHHSTVPDFTRSSHTANNRAL